MILNNFSYHFVPTNDAASAQIKVWTSVFVIIVIGELNVEMIRHESSKFNFKLYRFMIKLIFDLIEIKL